MNCKLDPSGSAAAKSYSATFNDVELKQETFHGRDTINDLFNLLIVNTFETYFCVDVSFIHLKCFIFMFAERTLSVSNEVNTKEEHLFNPQEYDQVCS